MSEVRIAAEPRTEFGKGAARRVRRDHKVPAVLYGHGDAPRHFSLPGHELMLALKHDANVLLTLETAEGDQLALPKVVVRDPLKNTLEHVDLVAVRKGEKVTVEIPVSTTGDAAPGVLVDQQTLTLTVTADATALPDAFEVDITGKRVGDSITAGDVALPAGTELAQDAAHVMVAFLGAPTEADVEADLAAAEEELGAGAAGAAALAAEDEAADGDAAGEGDVVAETDETPAQ